MDVLNVLAQTKQASVPGNGSATLVWWPQKDKADVSIASSGSGALPTWVAAALGDVDCRERHTRVPWYVCCFGPVRTSTSAQHATAGLRCGRGALAHSLLLLAARAAAERILW